MISNNNESKEEIKINKKNINDKNDDNYKFLENKTKNDYKNTYINSYIGYL